MKDVGLRSENGIVKPHRLKLACKTKKDIISLFSACRTQNNRIKSNQQTNHETQNTDRRR